MLLGWSPCLQVDEGALRLAGSGGKGVSAEGRRGKGGDTDTVDLGGASRDSTGCGIIQEGLISC